MSGCSDSRLAQLRRLMLEHELSAYIIPSEDAHQSEYVADCDKRRGFVSGFTGSAGTAVVTPDQALLFTDGRYFDQAEKELSEQWTLMKQGTADVKPPHQWIAQALKEKSAVGVDAFVTSLSTFRLLEKSLGEKSIEIRGVSSNLVDAIWSDRPALPAAKVNVHPLKYSGETAEHKLQRCRELMRPQQAHALVVSALDEIAWLFNLRGADIAYNPVFFAYAVVTNEDVTLYVDNDKLSDTVRSHLTSSVQLKPYKQIVADLKAMEFPPNKKVWLDPLQSSMAIFQSVPPNVVLEHRSPLCDLKAIKNEVETEGLRLSHIRDGAALVEYLCWLESNIDAKSTLDEVTVSDKLEQFRSVQDNYVGLSFETISGSGPNGAIIHYKAEKETARRLSVNEMYLVDSGAQYLDGTTDVTRTLHFGSPSVHERECFTRVLMGHIALARVVFPPDTSGHQLDVLARNALWQAGLNYAHGTGHGVGSYLNVHEGPQGISAQLRRISTATVALKRGMTLTNEPGYYESGSFGIRIESVMVVDDAGAEFPKDWMKMETITMAPIARNLLQIELMSDADLSWLNEYHADCDRKLSSLLSNEARAWLHQQCAPIHR